MSKKKYITVIGAGYVGMSLSVLLARQHEVTILEIDERKASLINEKKSTVPDKEIQELLIAESLALQATTNAQAALKKSEFIIISTPTDFDIESNSFNTESVEQALKSIHKFNSDGLIIIKSTVPIGFTKLMQRRYNSSRIIFSPEFLREDKALHDNFYPSRIIIGNESNLSAAFSFILSVAAKKINIPIIAMPSSEAEAVKLFSNTFLAMRVAYFNELDTFGMARHLDVQKIIEGVALDPRIGNFYNNPSFGYGGYCLPKDTRQLLSDYQDTPQNLIPAIIQSNETRKNYIIEAILENHANTVGIYRLAMKAGSSNHRVAAIIDILTGLLAGGKKVIIYEPTLPMDEDFLGCRIYSDLLNFKSQSEIIVANRMDDSLLDVKEKVFTRDIYGID